MSDRDDAELRGPVKKCSNEHDIVCPDHHWVTFTDDLFSPDGRLLERRNRNSDGSHWSIICRYDASGRIVEKAHSGAWENAEGKAFSYSYDAAGRLARVLRRSEKDGERLYESFQYAEDEASRQTSYPIPLPTGCEISPACALHISRDTAVTMTLLDGLGRPARKVLYDADDRVIRRIAFRYDPRGLLLEEGEIIDGQIREDFRNFYRYDESGRPIEADRKWGDIGGEKRTFTYNGRGDLTEVRIETTSLFREPEVERWAEQSSYQYDERGNWTERVTDTVRSNGEKTVTTIDRRELVYYD